jgi:hypothetical protein
MPMRMRIYITATVDRETAEALEREALQRKMRISPLVREVLDAHVARLQRAQPAPVSVTKDS